MKTITHCLFLLIFGVGQISVEAQDFVPKINSYLEELSQDANFGLSIVIAKNDSLMLQKAYGFADRAHQVPNTTETRFNIASIGKMFTAVAILQLKEEAKLDLQEKVGKYFPEFPNSAIRDSITIHELLTHTSGLPIWFNPGFASQTKFQYSDLRAYLPLIEAVKINYEKKATYAYSNVGYFVLGYLIEKITGMPYDEYIAKNILGPLEMNRTGNWQLSEIIDRAAVGYVRPVKDGETWKSNEHLNMGSSPAGGAYSTSTDLLKFMIGLRNYRLLNKENTHLMLSPKINTFYGNYGYGVALEELKGQEVIGHLGGFYGIRGELKWYKTVGYTIAVLANSDQTDYTDISYYIKMLLTGTAKEQQAYENTQKLIERTLADAQTTAADKVNKEHQFDESLIQIKAYYYLNNNDFKNALALFKLNKKLFLSEQSDKDLKQAKQKAASKTYWKAW